MTLRKCLFWLHLIAGLSAGLVIGMMSFTGVLLAFESEIVAWAERDGRIISAPSPGAPRLSLEELPERLRSAHPAARPTAIIISALPLTAVVFNVGREAPHYLDPYSGEARQSASTTPRRFMRLTTDWHRWLALSGDNRPLGRAITGAGNLAFLFLALSGIFFGGRANGARKACIDPCGSSAKPPVAPAIGIGTMSSASGFFRCWLSSRSAVR